MKPTQPENFALILTENGICRRDICRIEERTGLKPMFLSPISESGLHASRRYARLFGADLIRPCSARQLESALSSCSFTVTDSAREALISVVVGKPVFIDAENAACRALLSRLAASGAPRGLATAYTKNRTEHIREVGARGSDFKGLSYEIADRIIYPRRYEH